MNQVFRIIRILQRTLRQSFAVSVSVYKPLNYSQCMPRSFYVTLDHLRTRSYTPKLRSLKPTIPDWGIMTVVAIRLNP